MSRKIQIMTVYEQVSKTTGETYFKGAFGPFDVLLFKDRGNAMITQAGEIVQPWNVIVAENPYAKKMGRPLPQIETVENDLEDGNTSTGEP